MSAKTIGKWIQEDFSARRHHPDGTEAARVVELRNGRGQWVAWSKTRGEAKGEAENPSAARVAADAHLEGI